MVANSNENMKVILLQDVAKIGRRSEIVDVPAGYARNQLIPKKMAETATPANLKRIQRQHALTAEVQAAGASRFEAAVEALKAAKVTVAIEANEKGHTFKAVNEADIVTAAKAAGVDIEAAMVSIAAPIKELGEHAVELTSGAATASFTIEVIKK